MFENEVKKAENGFLGECHTLKIYSINFICQHTMEHIKLHYFCDFTAFHS